MTSKAKIDALLKKINSPGPIELSQDEHLTLKGFVGSLDYRVGKMRAALYAVRRESPRPLSQETLQLVEDAYRS